MERDLDSDRYDCGCCRCCGCSCDDDLFGYFINYDAPEDKYANYTGDEDNMPDENDFDVDDDGLDDYEDDTFEPFKTKKTKLRDKDV